MLWQVIRHLPILVAAAFLNFTSAATGRADSRTVVELFTSQACPVCRPAEEIIERLSRQGDVLALAFHVDYWDFTGWADPYADAAYSSRQRKYMARFNNPFLATPQFIIDGRWQSTDPLEAENLANTTASILKPTNGLPLDVRRIRSDLIRIQIGEHRAAPTSDVYILYVDRQRVTQVKTGDNAGEVLINSNIVRRLAAVTVYTGNATDLLVRVPADEYQPDFIAVLVQEIEQGPIYGTAVVDWN